MTVARSLARSLALASPFAIAAVSAGVLAACPSPPAAPPVTLTLNDAGTPTWLDDVAASCAKIVSCSNAHDPPRLRDPAACVDGWVARAHTPENPVQTCLAAAKTCDAVSACARETSGDPRAASFCASHPGAPTACDGNAFVSCSKDDSRESARVDCTAMNAKCEERKTGSLVARGCYSAALCPANAPDARCEGAAIVSCHEGVVEKTVCAAGTRCVAHKETAGDVGATCEPAAGDAHCEQVGGRYCLEDQLVECVVHGHYGDMHVSDCGHLGLRCAGENGRAACVIKKTVECEAGPARCEGDDLAFCAAGRRVKVSCRGLGLGRCDDDAQGPAAACAQPK